MEKTFMTFEQADELDIQDIFIGVDIDKNFKVYMFRDIDSSVMLRAMERVVKEAHRFNYDDHLYEVLAELMVTEVMYEEIDDFYWFVTWEAIEAYLKANNLAVSISEYGGSHDILVDKAFDYVKTHSHVTFEFDMYLY